MLYAFGIWRLAASCVCIVLCWQCVSLKMKFAIWNMQLHSKTSYRNHLSITKVEMHIIKFIVIHVSVSAIISLAVCFSGHFSRWTWVSQYQNVSVLDFIGAMDDGGCGDNWSYKMYKAPVKSSPPTNQHPVFLQAGCPSCHPTNSGNITPIDSPSCHLISDLKCIDILCGGDMMLRLWPEAFQSWLEWNAGYQRTVTVNTKTAIKPLCLTSD